MKKVITLIVLCVSISMLQAQPFNKEVKSSPEQPLLLGKINKEGLSQQPYSDWFLKNYTDYTPKQEIVNQLKNELSNYTIIAFMGTWCGDSKREIPKFYKVLDEVNFPLERLTMVAVHRDREVYKQSPGGEEEGKNIHRVPTFIFFKDGKEVNRIVESPRITIEEDILQIVTTSKYAPKYESVTLVNQTLANMGLEKFQKKYKKLATELKPITTNMYELNTYSNVLFFAGKKEEAIAVARLNLLLFPEEENAQKSLENKTVQIK